MKTKALLTTILAGSVAQLVHAVPCWFSRALERPEFVDVGGAYPDVYGNQDNALITGGFTIDFDDVGGGNGLTTPASPITGATGGLAVSNGNAITIDGAGSLLTQSTLTTEIRIGEETGGGSGAGPGMLTVSNGGTFNSGASLGVGVGTSFVGTGGNGLVNVTGGSSFVLGTGRGLGWPRDRHRWEHGGVQSRRWHGCGEFQHSRSLDQ